MKIAIITHHDVLNHGAMLQLYALKRVLEYYGEYCKALNYTKNLDFIDLKLKDKYSLSIKSIPFYFHYMLDKGILNTLFNIKKKFIIDLFKKNSDLIGNYYSKEEKIDAIFIGADEVFSIEPGLNTFFWGFGVPCKNVYSYAGSFGPTTLEFIQRMNAVEFIEGGIKRIKKISVRDRNSQNIIHELGHINVSQVCDPVILYGFKKERENFKRPLKEKYIVIYSYDNNMNDISEINPIITFAKRHNLKIISPGFFHKWVDKNINVNPIELLKYINFAELVITDTFHGSVCSIIMNTSFVTKIRANRNKLYYLLEEYELTNREIRTFEEIENLFNIQINYNKINEIIKNKQIEGINFIEDCLGDINE